MANITQAKSFIVVDELGVDPLRDKSFDAILSIQTWKPHRVTPEEQYNMPLIAYREYLNGDYWRVLMIYNGIADMFALREGMEIKIPQLALVATILNNVLVEEQVTGATVRI